MEQYIWLFPILFIAHDMEEIIGMRMWVVRNGDSISRRFPKTALIFNNFSTEGFALAVAEEFALILIICCLALSEIRICELIWLGTFIAFTLHLVVHIGQAIVIRKYIPSLATSIIMLPICYWTINDGIRITGSSIVETATCSIAATLAIGANLLFAHWLARRFNEWQKQKIQK